jgi:signal transduction histidine kinase
MATLRLIRDSEGFRNEEFQVGEVTSLGRTPANDVVLEHRGVSKEHARIVSQDDGYYLEDLNSSNGTYLNGEKIERSQLRNGDVIRIFDYTIEFVEKAPGESVGRDAASAPVADLTTLVATQSPQDLTGALGKVDPLQTLKRRLDVLYEVSRSAMGNLSMQSLLEVVLKELFKIFAQAEYGFVLIREDASGNFSVAASRKRDPSAESLTPSTTIIKHACDSRQAVLSASAVQDSRFKGAQSIVGSATTSVLCAPLIADEDVLGLIYVATRQYGSPFSEGDLHLVVCAAATAAIFLQNARLHEETLRSQRLATIGQAIAGVAHCVKNILNNLQFSTYVLDKSIPKDEKSAPDAVRGWNALKRNLQFLSNIVLDMLSYSKKREPLYQACPINDVCEDVVDLLQQHASEKGVKVLSAANDELPEVWIDEAGIKRCLINLAGNAIDACEKDKGEVRIEAGLAEADDAFKICVKDNGSGIDPESLEKIFDPFFSTKGGKGTGLGLAVTKKIVEEHGGALAVDSERGRGTTFILTLPIKPAQADGN